MENNQTMKASELRIGNYLKRDVVVKIDARSIFDIWEETKEYQPIPLTEEWLLRMGFDKKFNKGVLSIIPKGRLGYENGRTYFNSWAILESQPEYVHQLQNLYFALTNQELEIKES